MGKDTARGHPHVGPADPNVPDEHDLGSDLQGKNKLAGKNQGTVRNQRQTMPDESPKVRKRR
jgi:hypothetical protein